MNKTFEEFYKERFMDYYLEFAYEERQRFIEGFSRDFTRDFKMLGYDDATTRKTLLGKLFEMGFECREVDFVLHVDEAEWNEAKKGRVLDWEFIWEFRDSVKALTERFFVTFRENHPDFFEESA